MSHPGYKTYEYDTLIQADTTLVANKWRPLGQDGCLNYLYTKTVAGQGYTLSNIYAKVKGTMTGKYVVIRVDEEEVRKAGK